MTSDKMARLIEGLDALGEAVQPGHAPRRLVAARWFFDDEEGEEVVDVEVTFACGCVSVRVELLASGWTRPMGTRLCAKHRPAPPPELEADVPF